MEPLLVMTFNLITRELVLSAQYVDSESSGGYSLKIERNAQPVFHFGDCLSRESTRSGDQPIL